ncbi:MULTISPECIES: GNAT family N-acetyltransferase [Thioclava]|uniref:GNAT family N-acetyltransferase n=1 Tax=Thioclava electrotropha TaxID=1549850 RepID=A0ABX6YUV9_9RHOB|nr:MULTISPECIES: GNAT family N-acetyltransferase [Thioclava]OOY03445.1 GNAT family N-acetyltransferase [Thioclava sp. F28-4]OOY18862.1 GNAT family N-acetyltransferase [Thioclava sp. DLFJ5-1]OOY30939.1 GNAT family N-acetyltransferase [Thioclava sp. F36-6]QPZ91624.1 GNAT family N-acetyltransferase [Thioclava electrotropha]
MYQETISTQPVIETERFVLRPLRRSDAGLIEMYSGDKRVAEGTRAIPHPLPPGTAENFITRAQADDRVEDVWAIDGSRHGMGELLGVVSLTRLDDDQSEIGYWVGPGFWNTGLASEAVAAIIEANPQDARTLFAEVFQDNPGSARVLTNCGFEYLGDAESWSLARGRHVPTWTYLRKM